MIKRKQLHLLLASALIFSLAPIAPLTHASAATWHKGIPKVLHGTWITKRFYSKEKIRFKPGDPHHYRIRMYINSQMIDVLRDGGNSAGSVRKTKYRVLRHNVYQLKEYWEEGGTNKVTIRLENHKKAYVYAPFSKSFTKTSNSIPF